MLSKNKQKLITSLGKKKYRDQEQLFVAEGHKMISDLVNTNLKCRILVANDEWFKDNDKLIESTEVIVASDNELKKISALKSTPPVIAVFEQPQVSLNLEQLNSKLSLFLDDVQDPGNLGTIIRMADWFGIENIICTKGCADVYNPKTVQSTMGAIARINIHYIDSESFFNSIESFNLPVYGTFLNGRNIYESELENTGIIVMGNEGNGISPFVEKQVTSKLYIPTYPLHKQTSESLNVAVATAIVCGEFRRRNNN